MVVMEGNVFFFISSRPKGPSSQHCGLMETIRASGEFRIHEVVTVCADCRRNGVAMNCMHGAQPPWKSGGQQLRKAMILMQGDKRTFALELQNEDTEGFEESVFHHASVGWLQLHSEKWHYDEEFQSSVVFIGIDPACGGSRSRYAIVSAVMLKESPRAPHKLIVRFTLYYTALSCVPTAKRAPPRPCDCIRTSASPRAVV